jgi:putative ABC transport system permease protein
MGTLWWNLRHAFRTLHRSPGFALAAIISLGLGIGANTAIFSLVNALMLRPLPVRDPQGLLRIGPVDVRGFINAVPGPMFESLRKDPLLDGACGVNTPLSMVEVKDRPLPVPGHALSGDCYEILGVRPAIGRLFTTEDDIPTGPRVTVLSYAFWQAQFGGDPSVIGKSIRIEGAPFTIIGVTEPRFQGFLLGFPPSVSFPITQEVSPTRADPLATQVFYWGFAFVRVKAGVTAEQVRVRLGAEWRRLLDESLPTRIQGAERAEMLNQPLVVTSGAAGLDYGLRNRFQRPLFALLGISALVLLVSCINIANLLLARGLQRQREIAVRLALGASRWQVALELIVEGAILVAAGLSCALFLTNAGDSVLLALLSRAYSGFTLKAGADVRVLLFTSGAALAALLLFGVFPAWQISAVDLTSALKSGSRSGGSAQSRSRRILICGQVTLTLVLVMGANFFVEALHHFRHESLGFRTEDVLDVQLMPLPGGYAHGFNAATYYRDLLERIKSLPGVEAASLSHFSPLFSMPYNEKIRPAAMPDSLEIQAPVEQVSDAFWQPCEFHFSRAGTSNERIRRNPRRLSW